MLLTSSVSLQGVELEFQMNQIHRHVRHAFPESSVCHAFQVFVKFSVRHAFPESSVRHAFQVFVKSSVRHAFAKTSVRHAGYQGFCQPAQIHLLYLTSCFMNKINK